MYQFIVDATNLRFPCKIKNAVRDPNGKWPKDLGNAMVMRIDYFNNVLVANIVQAFRTFMETVG